MKIVTLILMFCVTVSGAVSLLGCSQQETKSQHVPSFELVALQKIPLLKTQHLKQGKLSVVNFWASWCIPCQVEHPLLVKLAQNKSLQLVGIAYRDKPENAARFLKKWKNPFHYIGLDQTGFAALAWGIQGMPETFVVNGEGRILFHHRGPLTNLKQIQTIIKQVQR